MCLENQPVAHIFQAQSQGRVVLVLREKVRNLGFWVFSAKFYIPLGSFCIVYLLKVHLVHEELLKCLTNISRELLSLDRHCRDLSVDMVPAFDVDATVTTPEQLSLVGAKIRHLLRYALPV